VGLGALKGPKHILILKNIASSTQFHFLSKSLRYFLPQSFLFLWMFFLPFNVRFIQTFLFMKLNWVKQPYQSAQPEKILDALLIVLIRTGYAFKSFHLKFPQKH